MRVLLIIAALVAWPSPAQEDQDDRSGWRVSPSTDWEVKPGTNWGVQPETEWGVQSDQTQDSTKPDPQDYPEAVRHEDDTRSLDVPEATSKEEPRKPRADGERSKAQTQQVVEGGKSKQPATGELTPTPDTHPERFEPIRGRKGRSDKETGEVWEKDLLHKDHFEVYRNKKDYESGRRDRSVWSDGRPKEKFKR